MLSRTHKARRWIVAASLVVLSARPGLLVAQTVPADSVAVLAPDSSSSMNGLDSTSTLPNDSLKLLLESFGLDSTVFEMLGLDSLALDTLVLDSLTLDSLLADTLGADSVKIVTIAPLDTAAAESPGPLSWATTPRDWDPHLPKNLGSVAGLIPGLFPRNRDLSEQPFYALTPGGTGRDTRLIYRGRSFDDPITDAANLSVFALGEVERLWVSSAWTAESQGVSGQVIRLDSYHEYPSSALTRIRYRQELYGLGNAEWRIAQSMGPTFSYHIGVNISQYRGRYNHTAANTAKLRFGMKTITSVGLLDFSWMQSDLKWERPYVLGTESNRRDEIDVSLSGGRRWQGNFREAALWYGRSRFGYAGGSEDGNRLGGRLQWEPKLDGHQFLFRSDLERVAMRMQPLSNGDLPGGQRIVAGATAQDSYSRGLLTAVAAGRAEAAQYVANLGDTDPFGYGRIGGRLALELGDTLGPRGEAGVTRSWRLPSLDETFGFWYRDAPSRSMDFYEVPGGISKVFGNPTLKPIMTRWAGVGASWVFSDRRSIRLRIGQRSWDRTYAITEEYYGIYGRSEADGFDALEATGQYDVKLIGPFSSAAAFTWTDLELGSVPMPAQWGWASLRSFNSFYGGQLKVMTATTARYWGEYSYNGFDQKEKLQLDLMVTLEIQGLQVYYSRNNLNDQIYDYTPGYPGTHRNEIWGVRWNLRN